MGVLEHLVPEDWQTARRNFERLERVFSLVSKDSDGFGFSVAGVGVRFGTLTLSWTAGSTSSASTLNTPHGLGKVPVVVWVFPMATGLPLVSFAQAFGLSATDFDAAGYVATAPGSNASVLHGWVAIG